jgi:hypothetical protein
VVHKNLPLTGRTAATENNFGAVAFVWQGNDSALYSGKTTAFYTFD